MREYFNRLGFLAKRILLLIVAFQILRLFYFIVNFNYFSNLDISEVLSIFFFGFRFDYAAIVYCNFLFIFISLLPFSFVDNKNWQSFLKFLFVFVNSILLLADLGDAVYFEFSNKRTTADFFSSTGQFSELLILLPQYLVDFWFVPLVGVALIFSIIFFYPKSKNAKRFGFVNYPKSVLSHLAIFMIFVVLASTIYFFARGFRLKPIRIITASEYTEARNIPLVLNTAFSCVTTISKEDLPEFYFFENKKLEEIYPAKKDFSAGGNFNKMNVVVIIMESFGKEYIGSFNNYEGYTPFLDSLLRKGMNCTNAFASGRRSIEALPAIISSIPALSVSPFITGQFATNKISGSPALLKKQGYHTSFFHGGRTGTMGFDYFAKLAGIDNYFGKEDFPISKHSDSSWGIYDEEFFQYFNNKLSTFSQPFFSCFFSLSSHHPYKIPEKYSDRFEAGPLEIHQSIRYADFALEQFFASAQKQNWYSNTLFVITADHTSLSADKKYQTQAGVYKIPIVFFQPSDSSATKQIKRYCSQIDIFPSIMDYINYPDTFISLGQSVFDSINNNAVVTYRNTSYQYLANDTALYYDGNDFVAVFDLKSDSLEENIIDNENIVIDADKNKLKAILQNYSQRMTHNKLVFDD